MSFAHMAFAWTLPLSDLLSALGVSASVASLALLLTTPFALITGLQLARMRGPMRGLALGLVLIPMVLPPVVIGFGLLTLFGTRGLLGGLLSALHIRLAFHFLGAVLAASCVGFPLFALSAKSAFESVDPRLEEMARTLGDSQWKAFRRVTLPLASRALGAGATLFFARALGEFGATMIFAGDAPGSTRTLALATYAALQRPDGDVDALALCAASLVLSALAIAVHLGLTRGARDV